MSFIWSSKILLTKQIKPEFVNSSPHRAKRMAKKR